MGHFFWGTLYMYQPTWRNEGIVSDLEKMTKSCKQSCKSDSQMPSQAVTLMFIPTIAGLWCSNRVAWGKPNKKRRYLCLVSPPWSKPGWLERRDRQVSTSRSTSPSPTCSRSCTAGLQAGTPASESSWKIIDNFSHLVTFPRCSLVCCFDNMGSDRWQSRRWRPARSGKNSVFTVETHLTSEAMSQ